MKSITNGEFGSFTQGLLDSLGLFEPKKRSLADPRWTLRVAVEISSEYPNP